MGRLHTEQRGANFLSKHTYTIIHGRHIGVQQTAFSAQTGFIPVSVLITIFRGEPGLASVIEVKDEGSGGDNWSAKLQSNRHHQQTNTQLSTGRMDVLPVARPPVIKALNRLHYATEE